MLYREPKLLKVTLLLISITRYVSVSVLYREPKLLKVLRSAKGTGKTEVSVLYREPKLLK